MNRIKLLVLALVMVAFAGCRDEDLNPIPVYETSVHGWGRFDAASARNFVYADVSKNIDIQFQWNAIDGILNVNKIEFYAFFDEAYKDTDGNDRIARHAGRFLNANGGGKLLKTLQASEIPANRADIKFTVTQADLYNLFKDAKFNYGKGEVPVYANPDRVDRTSATPFVSGDQLEVSWVLYTSDGRKFDFWSESICSEEFPKSSCSVKWGVVCVSDIGGEFDYVQTDMVKGDGAGGAAFPGTTSGTIKWVQDSTANPGAKPILGQYRTSDLSFGQFGFVWGDDPAAGTGATAPKIVDACNFLSTKGADQYGDTYTYKVLKVEGKDLTIRWNNTYDDAGTVKLTRKDGKDWPPLK